MRRGPVGITQRQTAGRSTRPFDPVQYATTTGRPLSPRVVWSARTMTEKVDAVARVRSRPARPVPLGGDFIALPRARRSTRCTNGTNGYRAPSLPRRPSVGADRRERDEGVNTNRWDDILVRRRLAVRKETGAVTGSKHGLPTLRAVQFALQYLNAALHHNG